MLTYNRKHEDGKYVFEMKIVDNEDYIISLFNVIDSIMLKEYKTRDDDSALAIYDTLIDVYLNEGEEKLQKFEVNVRLPWIVKNKTTVITE